MDNIEIQRKQDTARLVANVEARMMAKASEQRPELVLAIAKKCTDNSFQQSLFQKTYEALEKLENETFQLIYNEVAKVR